MFGKRKTEAERALNDAEYHRARAKAWRACEAKALAEGGTQHERDCQTEAEREDFQATRYLRRAREASCGIPIHED